MKPRFSTLKRRIADIFAADPVVGSGTRRYAAGCLASAGVEVTAYELALALDTVAVERSVFGPPAAVVRSYSAGGMEYRIKSDHRDAANASVAALYAVTDQLPRETYSVPLTNGPALELERFRPRAFARCRGELMARWLRGNFSVPTDATIISWVAAAFPDATFTFKTQEAA